MQSSVIALLAGSVVAAQPTTTAWRAELEAEWTREDRTWLHASSPSGEPQGATTQEDAAGGCDGVKDGGYGFHTTFSLNPWWQVDLGETVELDRIVVYNRCEGARQERASGLTVLVSQDGATWQEVFRHSGPPFGGVPDGNPLRVGLRANGVRARFVRCMVPQQVSFHLDEVEVYAARYPDLNIALHRPADQSSAGRWSRAKGRAGATSAGFSPAHTADVLRRARQLLAELQRLGLGNEEARDLGGMLAGTEARVAAAGGAPTVEARRDLYFASRGALRRVALANPLLDIGAVLLVKRHPGTFAHMCDQYYGGYARAGGGLFVLEGFAGEPRLRDIIGDRLPRGSFLGPDLSFDGMHIAFAYVPVDPARKPDFSAAPEHCYHVYTVNVDGTGLRQVTDGPWDDFDPCWLPDGDLVFVSSRRGGYCRCGARPVPTYTLHRMHADGSGIRRLSSHETNEWNPVVGNDGSIIYTRWDYVDRHTNLAQGLWSCLPDGSGAMAIYGNYNVDRKPWGEWHPCPVPGSPKLAAVAGAHHGYAFGSVVMIDPQRGYDGAGPLERFTPDVAFPEAEGYPGSAYTTPFPLSEDLALVCYSPEWNTRDASHTVTQGIYSLDRFGNRELLYRDPTISCESPIPLRPRPRPVVYPSPPDDAPEGRFVLLNVYDSLDPLPARVTHLRIVQVLPKTTIVADQPPISAARQVSARQLLGTVPVEPDGSAHFVAPPNVPLYFQAVDADGMAVQTMRSIAYLQPGETRSCGGCHEPRQTAPRARTVGAVQRGPSPIDPGPDGSRPFSYPRLVQPVLDRHCVGCHSGPEPAGKLALTGQFGSASDPYSVSYRSLARRQWVHWFDSVNGGEWIPVTKPGEFGARASRLIALLRAGHEGAKLPPDDLERLCLWIDLNVPFYGTYEPQHVAVQRAGGVPPLGEVLP
jgi:Hydrazine synthase alpha subunit middle domain/F5/8 type C domain